MPTKTSGLDMEAYFKDPMIDMDYVPYHPWELDWVVTGFLAK